MKYFEDVPAVLLLEDGTVYHGRSIGKVGMTIGELCFNTGMTGYQEIFTDPSYYGQVLIMTNVHIGNYGTMAEEIESNKMKISGLVCKNFTNLFSRKQATQEIQDYFLEEGMVGITDIDTRAVVRHIRDKGAMNAIISSQELDTKKLKQELDKAPSMAGLELASKVSTEEPYHEGSEAAPHRVAVLDIGVKKSILNNLTDRGCYLKVFPAKTTFEEMEEWDPDGYFISNGPGDPAAMPYAVETVKKILQKDKPLFGICLGHQILALANGLTTYKMHNGHRGANHPVINLATGKCEITTQNHGFGVQKEDIKKNKDIEPTHMNLNDDTLEGIKVKNKKAFSVQYHPEASPGPHDSRYLFDDFVELVKSTRKASGRKTKVLEAS